MELTKDQLIIEKYLEIVKNTKRLPVYGDFKGNDISRDAIRHHFGNINTLHRKMKDEFAEQIREQVLLDEFVFTQKNLEKLDDVVKQCKRFVITTVVSGKELFDDGYSSIKHYCEKNDASLLLIPCQDIWDRSKDSAWHFPTKLDGELFIWQDTALNSNIFVSSIKMSAKHINPTTGLGRIGQKNGSYIFASPKQYLEFIVNSTDVNTLPSAMMTTGAITTPDYYTDKYMSERVSYIAENDHVMGGLIVEIENDQIFHFRQFQFGKDGSFVDLGTVYKPSGKTDTIGSTLIMGDYHAGETCENVKSATKEMCDFIKIRDIFVHDMFDGRSINHYDDGKPLAKVMKMRSGSSSLQEELEIGGKEFNFLHSIIPGNVYRVESNHDDRVQKYLMQGKYIDDPENHYISLDLARALLDGEDVGAYAYLKYGGIKEPNRIIWLSRDEECKISNVECGQHGDLGMNGSRGSLNGVEKAYGNCIVGHSHSAAIMRGVYRVGTSTRLKLGYNKGPSSWTNTHCILYDNGMRQLVNVINNTSTNSYSWKI